MMMKTRSAYTRQIRQLDGHVFVVGQSVVEDIRNTGRAIGGGNSQAADEVVDGHDAFERLHRSIEDTCMSLMLLQQPMAQDLRLVTAAFRAISDLARIDEMAYEIALLSGEVDLGSPSHVAAVLVSMSKKAATMVNQAVASFESGSVSDAEQVFAEDDALDELYGEVCAEVVRLLKTDGENAELAPEILSVAKYYERMGDHAQSVSDWSIFRATGRYRGRSMGERD